MKTDHQLITFIPFIIYMVNEMVVKNDLLSREDILFQKSVRYQHHKENYLKSLMEGITPRGLELKKRPAFAPILEDFTSNWDEILFKAQQDLVKLLLIESDGVIEKINFDIQQHLLEEYPDNLDNKRLQMEKNQAPLVHKLKKRRDKNWSNFISRASKNQISPKEITDSKEITSVSIEEERSNDKINIPQVLTIVNTKEKEEMQSDSKIEKKRYAERVKENTKPKGNINVNNTKICFDQGGDVRVENFKIDETNITDNRNTRKKAKQNIMDKKVENQVLEGTSDVHLSLIYSELLNDESNVSYQNISPPSLILDSLRSLNHFNARVLEDHTESFSTQDKEFSSLLESIGNMNDSLDSSNKVSVTSERKLSGYFCSETVLNLSRKVLTETEIQILEKGLDFAPIQRKINEPELKRGSEEFCRKVRVK